MILGGRSLYNLTIADFESLVENHVPEGPHIEYKRTAYSGRTDDIREMLRDISALANADGGYIIMGIQEDGFGRAESFSPIENHQQIAQSIRQTCLDGIQERIPNLEVQDYELAPNQGIIVAYIPLSNQRPHMVTREHRTDFYRRYGTDKRSMTIGEIRDIFLTTPAYRQIIEYELLIQGRISGKPNEKSGAYSTYMQLLTERSVERFLQRYIQSSIDTQVLVIVSPFISDLSSETYKLSDVVKKINTNKTRTYVITREPKDEYQFQGMAVLQESPYIEIRYNPDVHAKLFVCWSREEEESFALFGSGNLTSGGVSHNFELGMMILSRGYGRKLVRELYDWGSFVLRTKSQRIKEIEFQTQGE
jgi:hypothetical protein